MATIAEKLINEGMENSRLEGRKEGRQEARQELVEKIAMQMLLDKEQKVCRGR